MIYFKINGIILQKEKKKENDSIVYILTENYGILKCYIRGIFRSESKNLSLFEPGNLNRLFILTNFYKYQIISALPLKITTKTFNKNPFIFLWALKIVKNLKLIETPKFIWFILTHLENYIKQNSKNFPYWFLFHILKELGYEIDFEKCYKCQRNLKNFAFFYSQKYLVCFYCKQKDQKNYILIKKEELTIAQKIKNLVKIPEKIPDFLKTMITRNFSEIFQKINN
jgi:DNA repair protein RecO